MSGDLMRVTQQKWLKSLAHVGMLAITTLLPVALAPPAHAQTFDQAITDALTTCFTRISPIPGSGLFSVCAGGASGASLGSTTTLTRESTPVEERKIERVVGPFNLFISGGYERFDKDVTKFEPGYTTDTGRATIGADYLFSDRLLVGGAFNYTHDDGKFKGGGRFDTNSYGGLLHLNFVPAPKFFIDGTAGYTRRDYFISREYFARPAGGPFTLRKAAGDTDGNEYKVGLNGGYDFNFQNITIGPRLGLHYKHTKIDGYRERGGGGVDLIYDSQREKSLTSVVGLYGAVAISTGLGILIPQATVEYLHEFEHDQRRIKFRFVEDQNAVKFRFQNDPPDRNYFNIGLGIVAQLARGFAPFVNYRTLVGYKDQSSHAVTAGLRVEF